MSGVFRAFKRTMLRERTQAQSFVELALVLPVLLFMVMGTLQIALFCMLWIGLQGITQDTARWMAVSSQSPSPGAAPTCTPGVTNWPRPRWADGDDGVNYRDCNLPTMLRSASFTTWSWSPACSNGTDCLPAGARHPNVALTLTATYNWSHIIIMPGIAGGGLPNFSFPTTVTVTASEVMQY